MKKFIYILALITFSTLAITSCTEEEVAPKNELENGGGGEIITGKN